MRYLLVLLFCLFLGSGTMLHAQQRGMQLPVTTCLQYQKMKSHGGASASRVFREYGLHPLVSSDKSDRLWGYHAHLDTTLMKQKPLYRAFKRYDIYSFAVIDGSLPSSPCQYVFWWKGYYRRFADDLRRLGFEMTNDKQHTNVLRFSKKGVDIVVDFIIWDDIYVMQLSLQSKS